MLSRAAAAIGIGTLPLLAGSINEREILVRQVDGEAGLDISRQYLSGVVDLELSVSRRGAVYDVERRF